MSSNSIGLPSFAFATRTIKGLGRFVQMTYPEDPRSTNKKEDDYPKCQAYSYGHLPVITGYKCDYTFYKWGYKHL